MDDKRTPMEAEVQELPMRRECAAEDFYGTAVRPRPQRSFVGLWICVGLAVIAVCTFCVVAALSHVQFENGEGGIRLAVRDSEETKAPEDPIVELPVTEGDSYIRRNGADSEDVRLPVAETAGEILTPAEIYEKVSPAVVCVQVNSYYGSADYSGVVVASDGYILTATKGLTNAVSISVTLADGSERSARRLGEDLVSGVCLLKIEAEGLPTVRFSEETEHSVGERVYCICNPYGSQIPNVFYDGMLSVCQTVDIGGKTYELLQSSARQDQAGCGSPILDDRGLVLGITTPIGKRLVSDEDPCFAISSVDLARIVTGFEETASSSSVWLGLEVEDIPEEYQYLYGFPGCVWIDEVAVGSASYGVLFQYDVVLAVDGTEVRDAVDYQRILSAYEPGDRVLLTIYRSGKQYQILLPVLAR